MSEDVTDGGATTPDPFAFPTQHPHDLAQESPHGAPHSERLSRAMTALNRLEMFERGLEHMTGLPTGADLVALKRNLNESDAEELAASGLDVTHANISAIARAIVLRSPMVEIETVLLSPHRHTPTRAERVGLTLASMLRHVFDGFDRVRLVAVLDDMDAQFSEADRDAFALNAFALLRDTVVLAHDQPGKDVVLVRRSRFVASSDALLEALELSPHGSITYESDGSVVFWPNRHFINEVLGGSYDASVVRRIEILTAPSQVPTEQAASAGSFFDPANRYIMHVNISEQRDAVTIAQSTALSVAVGTTGAAQHHHISYNSDEVSPVLLAYMINRLLHREIRLIADELETLLAS